jgi:hypothetical protein
VGPLLVDQGGDAVSKTGKTAVDTCKLLYSDLLLARRQVRRYFKLLGPCQVYNSKLSKAIYTDEQMISSPSYLSKLI